MVPVNTSNPVRTVNPTNLPQDNQPSKDNDHPHGTSMAAEYKITKDSNEHGNSMAGEFKTRSPTGRSSLMSVSAYEGAGCVRNDLPFTSFLSIFLLLFF